MDSTARRRHVGGATRIGVDAPNEFGASSIEKEIFDAYERTCRKTRPHGQTGHTGDAAKDGLASAHTLQARALPTGNQTQTKIISGVSRLAL